MNLTNGFIVIETRVPIDENMINPCAKQTRDIQFEKLGIFITKECKKTIDKKDNDQHPFKNSI